MLKKLSQITEKYAQEALPVQEAPPVHVQQELPAQEVAPSELSPAATDAELVYAQLEQAYNNDRRGLVETMLNIFGKDDNGQRKVTAFIAFRARCGQQEQERGWTEEECARIPLKDKWPDFKGIRINASLSDNLVKNAALEKYAELSIREEDARAMAKAIIGSQLVDGWMVSESAFKKLYKTLGRLLHPDVFDGRARAAEDAGKAELAEKIKENKAKGERLYKKVFEIVGNSLAEGGDDRESGLLNGMDDINTEYPLSKLLGFMIQSPKFPGFYLNDLAYTLVMIDKELPTRFKVGPDKLKEFLSKDGVSVDFDYIGDYYGKWHGTQEDIMSAFPDEFADDLAEDESSFAFSPYERFARGEDKGPPSGKHNEGPSSQESSDAHGMRTDPPMPMGLWPPQEAETSDVQSDSIPDYDPSMGRGFRPYMEDFVSRFNPAEPSLESEEEEDEIIGEDEDESALVPFRASASDSMSSFYKLFNSN